jgi:hypothetical protein
VTPPLSTVWSRSDRIEEVRDRIWSYLSPASRFEVEGLLVAAALLRWPEADAVRLGELQFLLSAEVGAFLDGLPQLARQLSVSSDRAEQWGYDKLRGPVQWQRTLAARAATGAPHVFVTTPSHRVYQTTENELLVHVLDAVATVARRTGWAERALSGDGSQMVRDRLSEAERWQQSRMLQSVERVPPTPRSLSRIRSGRQGLRYTRVLSAHRQLVSLVEELDRPAIRSAIENAGLVTADDSTLFELLTTFKIIDRLNDEGWNLRPIRLFEGSVHTFGHRDDGRRLDLWYQLTPRELAEGAKYVHLLGGHGLVDNRPLRPDLTLSWTDKAGQRRRLVVECKLSQTSGVTRAARKGLFDLLAYRRNFDRGLRDAGQPYGLGVAWGSGLDPDLSVEVALCTPDTIGAAMSMTSL